MFFFSFYMIQNYTLPLVIFPTASRSLILVVCAYIYCFSSSNNFRFSSKLKSRYTAVLSLYGLNKVLVAV